MNSVTIFANDDLLPDAWRAAATGPLRVFNPALLRHGDGWLLAYRVVAEPDSRRRIALCRLDATGQIVSGSPIPWSDRVRFPAAHGLGPEAETWFADPRLYRFGGRLFIYWNSGWHEPQNHQFLHELDPRDFSPVGGPRELRLATERRKLEKNWTFFGDDPAQLHAIYSIDPHRVLAFSVTGAGPIEFRDAGAPRENSGGHAQLHGGLRGGAPPQLHAGHYYSFCHSVHDAPDGYAYRASVYRFAATAPFAPTDLPAQPLALPNPTGARRTFAKLNPAVGEVIYPSGAAWHDGAWLVSYGLNDERCALAHLPHAAVLATLTPAAT